MLGLKVSKEWESLVWKRNNEIDVPSQLTRRSVFSCCGKLVGHYPVCGWVRVAAAYLKRRANHVTESWDERIRDERSEYGGMIQCEGDGM